jgi:hypothetical protein
VVVTCAIYYDSRSSIYIILAVLIYYLLILVRRRFSSSLKLLFLGSLILLIDFSTTQVVKKYIPFDFDSKTIGMPTVLNFDTSDYGRIVINLAAYDTIDDSIITMLVGHGWYMARYEMKSSLTAIRSKLGLDTSHIRSDISFQPSGAAAMLVDTGVIGVLLYLINLLLSLIKICKSDFRDKYIISIIYMTMTLWFFIGNITPMLLTFFLIMPNNPIQMMANTNRINNTPPFNTK